MLPQDHADRIRLVEERVQPLARPRRGARPSGWRASSAAPGWRRCRRGASSRSSRRRRRRRRNAPRPPPRRLAERRTVAGRRILLGVIGRPHGVRGLVRVHSYTADPAGLPRYGAAGRRAGRQFALRWRGEGDRRTGRDRGRQAGQDRRPRRGRAADQHAALRRSRPAAARPSRTSSTSPIWSGWLR